MVLGSNNPWLAAIPMIVLWTPTTLAIVYSRYLSRAWDERPVVLMSGLTLSRANFRVWMAAQAAEGVIAGGLVMSLAITLLAMPTALAWIAPVMALAGFYAISARILRVRLGRGVVALAENDPHAAIAAVDPILSWSPLAWSLAPTARLVRVQSYMLLGDRDAAIAECDRVRVRGGGTARAWKALLTVSEDTDQAAEVFDTPPRLLGQAWHQALLYDLLALHRNDRASLDASQTQRRTLAAALGPRAAALSKLIDAARKGLDGTPGTLDHRARQEVAFAATIWPRVWELAVDATQKG
ncbi:MAG: hypothetical protein ACJAZO_001952 [Myxococcota bacterium]|jgi:hypothetical protein